MPAKTLDGLAVSREIFNHLRATCDQLYKKGIYPGLATVLVGSNPASRSYVLSKHKDCQTIGVKSTFIELPDDVSEKELLSRIKDLNQSKDVSGIIVQLPLPNQNQRKIIEAIDPMKDADGLTSLNLGYLVSGGVPDSSGTTSSRRLLDTSVGVLPEGTRGVFNGALCTGSRETSSDNASYHSTHGILPCTPAGIVKLLEAYSIPLKGKTVAVIGRGTTVGRPLGILLSGKEVNATVINIHSHTHNAANLTRIADVVIACAGVKHIVEPSWIKPGATVVDVGVNQVGISPTGKMLLAGDVHPHVKNIANYLSPVIGGVGPMTRAMLMSNVINLAARNCILHI